MRPEFPSGGDCALWQKGQVLSQAGPAGLNGNCYLPSPLLAEGRKELGAINIFSAEFYFA